MPPDSDTSISANILRIKMFRNEVYAHVTTTEVINNTFNKLWEKISKALVALGIPSSEIDELKEEPLCPEEDGYICQLEEWKKEEDKLIEITLDTNAAVQEVKTFLISINWPNVILKEGFESCLPHFTNELGHGFLKVLVVGLLIPIQK